MRCEMCGYKIRGKNHERGRHHERATTTGARRPKRRKLWRRETDAQRIAREREGGA